MIPNHCAIDFTIYGRLVFRVRLNDQQAQTMDEAREVGFTVEEAAELAGVECPFHYNTVRFRDWRQKGDPRRTPRPL